MKEVKWKRFKIWRFEIRTNNIGWWFAVTYRPNKGCINDVTFSFKNGFNFNKLPF